MLHNITFFNISGRRLLAAVGSVLHSASERAGGTAGRCSPAAASRRGSAAAGRSAAASGGGTQRSVFTILRFLPASLLARSAQKVDSHHKSAAVASSPYEI